MKKDRLKNLSSEILLERKKKIITTLRILFLVSLFGFFLFLNAYNNTKEITIIHVILAVDNPDHADPPNSVLN